ncbi:MAG: sigma-70 family RNA polymerase sigma factor [Phycisphaerales bacterium]|nr:sigma-70 family RNA polymerase sigma factor [Phycisphaerales bacterium]
MMDRHEELLRTTTTTALLDGLFNADDGVVWQVFDERYRPIMVGVGRRLGLSDSEAEDVAQETLLQFLRDYRANRYDREKGRLRGWIAGIARHRVIDYQRKRGRRKEKSGGLSSLLEVPDEAGIAELWDLELERSILRQSVEELRRTSRTSEKSIKAFEMVIFERRPVEAVAEELGMKTHDVYVARSRVTTRLREIAERLRALYEVDA